MAATVNTNVASTGESIGSPRSPPRRASSGAVRTSSPTWNQIVCGAGPEAEALFAHPPPPPPLSSSESLATAVVPEFGYEMCYQFAFFVVTALLKFDKVTDFAGSTNFVILALLTLIVKGTWHFRQVIYALSSVEGRVAMEFFDLSEAGQATKIPFIRVWSSCRAHLSFKRDVVPRKFTSDVDGKMGYEDFVYFILAEEDKSSEPSLEYWS